ncbi:GNAT family N-acetyltransferase [Spirosoma taeanense]|uniref:GNAT family N-acetyltransferase n=1 Tax=Spirosoma taeanense TaxID=2735870 RepID=A0A6M5Y6T1_9BACT|nr:GNAT family N-acetyltransferase [Spirosoma taeanense]QJW89585.1 GNAT family N-acetyltransferase [Spirosoma taeanense]
MSIRPYQPTDADTLLSIFRRHVPNAFGEEEVAEYADFLNTFTDPYFVAEHSGQVIGACGYYVVADGQTARIVWILTDPDRIGSGVGSALMQHTLNEISQHPGVRHIECRTSQVAYHFFERFGFRLQYTESNFWVPGLDLYFMTLSHD